MSDDCHGLKVVDCNTSEGLGGKSVLTHTDLSHSAREIVNHILGHVLSGTGHSLRKRTLSTSGSTCTIIISMTVNRARWVHIVSCPDPTFSFPRERGELDLEGGD